LCVAENIKMQRNIAVAKKGAQVKQNPAYKYFHEVDPTEEEIE
jgi:hypothetical protein